MQGNKSNILTIDLSGEIISSDNYELLLNLQKKKITNIRLLVPEEQSDEISKIIPQIKTDKTVSRIPKEDLFNENFEFVINSAIPSYTDKGEIINIALNLSENKIKNKDIVSTEIKFESLFNHAHDAIFVTDLDGNYLEVNKTAIQRTGFNKEEFYKLNIKNMPVSGNQISFNNYFKEILSNTKSTANINYIHKNGSIVETEISGKLINFTGQQAILHISREISARNKSHANDIDTVLKGEEKERSLFAGQINDIVGANLSLLKMYVETFLKNDNVEHKKNTAKKINAIIDSSLTTMSEISNKISPHVLKNLGIKTALKVFLENTQKNSDILFMFDLNIPDRIPESKTVTIYRIFVEIINNISKHSMAKNAIVYAEATKEWLFFDIKDNGKGFDFENKLTDENCIGLLNIFNKTKSINGIIDYISVIGKGTAIKLKVPIIE